MPGLGLGAGLQLLGQLAGAALDGGDIGPGRSPQRLGCGNRPPELRGDPLDQRPRRLGGLARIQRRLGARGGRACGRRQPLGLALMALPALIQAGPAGRRQRGGIRQLAPLQLQPRVLLVGARGNGSAFGLLAVAGRHQRLQFSQPAAVCLQIAGGQVAGRIAAGKFVGAGVAPGQGLAGSVGRLRGGCASRGQFGPGRLRAVGGCRSLTGSRLGGSLCRRQLSLQRRQLAAHPVALGPSRQPRRLAGVGRPPQLSALDVDALAGAGHRHPRADDRQIVHQPHALDQPGHRRIADGDNLGQRPRSRTRRQPGLAGGGAGQHDSQLAVRRAQQLDRLVQPLGDHRARSPAQRCGNRSLEPGRGLDTRHHQRGPGGVQRPGGGREALAVLQRPGQASQPGGRQLVPVLQLVRRRPGVPVGGCRSLLGRGRIGLGRRARLQRRLTLRRLRLQLGGLAGGSLELVGSACGLRREHAHPLGATPPPGPAAALLRGGRWRPAPARRPARGGRRAPCRQGRLGGRSGVAHPLDVTGVQAGRSRPAPARPPYWPPQLRLSTARRPPAGGRERPAGGPGRAPAGGRLAHPGCLAGGPRRGPSRRRRRHARRAPGPRPDRSARTRPSPAARQPRPASPPPAARAA